MLQKTILVLFVKKDYKQISVFTVEKGMEWLSSMHLVWDHNPEKHYRARNTSSVKLGQTYRITYWK